MPREPPAGGAASLPSTRAAAGQHGLEVTASDQMRLYQTRHIASTRVLKLGVRIYFAASLTTWGSSVR
jgi:hypothetical protein